jgi:hypothetical protein
LVWFWLEPKDLPRYVSFEAPGRLARVFIESQVVNFFPDAHRLAFSFSKLVKRVFTKRTIL